MVKIVVVTGSVRPNSAGQQVVPYVVKKLQEKDAVVSVADLSKLALPFFDSALPPSMEGFSPEHQSVLQWTTMVKEADGVVLVSPEYNHAAPASLTNAISFLNKEWNRKPVALVSYGTVGGVRAAEHLRAVAGELHMADIRPQVAILNPWAMKDENGEIKEELVIGDPVEQAQDLLWWANALKNAK